MSQNEKMFSLTGVGRKTRFAISLLLVGGLIQLASAEAQTLAGDLRFQARGAIGDTVYLQFQTMGAIRDIDGITPLSGEAYRAQIYLGLNFASTLIPFGSPIGFGTGYTAGLFDSGPVAVAGVAPGSTVVFQLRIWERAAGADYFSAIQAGGKFGSSEPVTIFLSGGVIGPPFLISLPPFRIEQAPKILQQPVSQNVLGRAGATFSVMATSSVPLSFQWRLNGTNLADGSRITGTTGRVLQVTDVRRSDAGNYSLVISNWINTLVSSNAMLRVLVPQRLRQPQIIGNSRLGVTFGDEDGGLLSTYDVLNFTAQGSVDLLHWFPLTNRIEALPEGLLQLKIPMNPALQCFFFRIAEEY